jgi:hypothetical protein
VLAEAVSDWITASIRASHWIALRATGVDGRGTGEALGTSRSLLPLMLPMARGNC